MSQMSYQAYYGDIFKKNEHILGESDYQLIEFLQENFNHEKNGIDFNNKDVVTQKFRLLKEENEEMTDEGLTPKNLKKLRDAIADQLTIGHFLAMVIDGLSPFGEKTEITNINTPKSYTEYCQNIDNALAELEVAFNGDDILKAQYHLDKYLAIIHKTPDFIGFVLADDLRDVTLSSLSKICPNTEIAEETLASYKNLGYACHIGEVNQGYAIFVSEDCVIDGKLIPKGKFLKSVKKLDPLLNDVNENSIW